MTSDLLDELRNNPATKHVTEQARRLTRAQADQFARTVGDKMRAAGDALADVTATGRLTAVTSSVGGHVSDLAQRAAQGVRAKLSVASEYTRAMTTSVGGRLKKSRPRKAGSRKSAPRKSAPRKSSPRKAAARKTSPHKTASRTTSRSQS